MGKTENRKIIKIYDRLLWAVLISLILLVILLYAPESIGKDVLDWITFIIVVFGLFIFFWCIWVDMIQEKDYLWAVFSFLIPFLVLIYYFGIMRSRWKNHK